jgi:N utilization substance protein B
MKTKLDPRHLKRKQAVKELFAESYTHQGKLSDLTTKIYKKRKTIDKIIQRSAPTWPIDKLNKIDLAILRLAVYELMYETNTPHKVVIDEAVELAKEYGAESSANFINGALGSVFTETEKKNG